MGRAGRVAGIRYSSALNRRIGVLDIHMEAEANVADAACILAGDGMAADRAPAWQCLWLLSFGVERRACERQVEFVIVPAEPPESCIAARSKLPANLLSLFSLQMHDSEATFELCRLCAHTKASLSTWLADPLRPPEARAGPWG